MLLIQYVVFGATGYIGSYIFEQLKNIGFNVTGTSRRESCIEEKIVIYDILNDNLNKLMPRITDADRMAIVCIAEPNIDRCYEDYSNVYRINVTRTKALIHDLWHDEIRNRAVFVIYRTGSMHFANS